MKRFWEIKKGGGNERRPLPTREGEGVESKVPSPSTPKGTKGRVRDKVPSSGGMQLLILLQMRMKKEAHAERREIGRLFGIVISWYWSRGGGRRLGEFGDQVGGETLDRGPGGTGSTSKKA